MEKGKEVTKNSVLLVFATVILFVWLSSAVLASCTPGDIYSFSASPSPAPLWPPEDSNTIISWSVNPNCGLQNIAGPGVPYPSSYYPVGASGSMAVRVDSMNEVYTITVYDSGCWDANGNYGLHCFSTAYDSFTISPYASGVCGDGVLQPGAGEECDDGSQNGVVCTASYKESCTYCSSTCLDVSLIGPYCGDDIIQNPPEQCDYGSLNSNSGECIVGNEAVAGCKNAVCGDGFVYTGVEACDAGTQNGVSGSGCSSTCTIVGPACTFSSASWGYTSVYEGASVPMNVVGTNCDGRAVNFSIRPATGLLVNNMSGTFPSASWLAQYVPGGSNIYTFSAMLTDNAGVSKTSTNSLSVLQAGGGGGGVVHGDGVTQSPEQCDDGNVVNGDGCSSIGVIETGYTCTGQPSVCTPINNNGPTCALTSASWSAPQAKEGDPVSLLVGGTNCDGKTVSFVVREYDTVGGGDAVRTNPSNVTFSGSTATGRWTAEWQNDNLGGNPEYYFTATVAGATGSPISSSTSDSLLLHVNQSGVFQCSQVSTCGGYRTLEDCTLDQCSVVDSSVPAGVDCSNNSNTLCRCSWDSNAGTCNANVDGPAGLCTFTQTSSGDTCDDGFLTFSWTASWAFAPGKTAADDTTGLRAKCVDGSKTVECPAQIALPFFSTYSIIGVVIVIALIYWALTMRKSGKGRRKK